MIRFNEMIEKMENKNQKERLKYLKKEMKKLKEELDFIEKNKIVKIRYKKR